MTAYPTATPANMALLSDLLDKQGVETRVSSTGELLFRDSKSVLSDADRCLIRHYAEALSEWIRNPIESADSEGLCIQALPNACPNCAQAEDDRHAYRTDDRVGLLVRCVDCGCTWPWGCPDEPLSQQQQALGRSPRRRRSA